jgi:hypothetical protein
MRHAPLAAVALAAALSAAPSLACAAPRPGPARSGPWSVELVDEGGRALPTFQHKGRTFVLGEKGQRYLLRVRNGSGKRVEVVASVDGRDVVDGNPSALDKRGYLVDPYGELTVDGFRLGLESVAAFRFSSVSRSYAARMGDARDVGVIGVAIFPEREQPPIRRWSEDELARNEGKKSADRGAASEAPSAAEPPSASRSPAPAPGAPRAESRPGLGTEFGEEHASAVREVPFERASTSPAALLSVRYDDRAGLARLGIDVDGALARRDDRWLREHAQPFRSSYAEPPPGWER